MRNSTWPPAAAATHPHYMLRTCHTLSAELRVHTQLRVYEAARTRTPMSGIACCVGTLSDGTPEGKTEILNGVSTYLAPCGSTQPEFAIVLLSDIFGSGGVNMQVLADTYGKQNPRVMCVVPDILPGAAIPEKIFDEIQHLVKPTPATTFWKKLGAVGSLLYYLPGFFMANSHTKSVQNAEKCIEYLRKERGIKKIACIGYCWGGTCSLMLAAQDNAQVDAVCACHPGPMKIPADLAALKKPSCFVLPTNDFSIKLPQIIEITEFMDKRQPPLRHLVKKYEGMDHGFACRGDEKDPEIKRLKDDAFETTYKFVAEEFGL
jgi:dienelactone hydrolase